MLPQVIRPPIQFKAQLCRDKFRLTGRNACKPLPATHTVQPIPAELGLIEQTMNVGAPDKAARTYSAFVGPAVGFFSFRHFDVKTRIDSSTTGTPHMDFITTDWRAMSYLLEQRGGIHLPADLRRFKLRRHVEKSQSS